MTRTRINPADISVRPLAERRSFLDIESIAVDPAASPPDPGPLGEPLQRLARRIVDARRRGAAVMLTYGAHVIKNGCGPLINAMLEGGWLTHLATQGAGIIHDWEFAHLGRSSESVRDNAPAGRFGTWDETGRWIIDAAVHGAAGEAGLGEALGALMADHPDRHPWAPYSVTATAHRCGVPLCVMPGLGYDIYCCHPLFTEDAGAALGRCATRDFHTFCAGVGDLVGGVYLSVGSAIMSPQVFEKAFSIANNLRLGRGEPAIHDHHIAVVDIQESGGWDWSKGEPPQDHPAYYLRFFKSFYRLSQAPEAGGSIDYLEGDNRLALSNLVSLLSGERPPDAPPA